ncbi:CoA transferase, partial [uncultured Pseudacidovorax sp.]|uniref:CoA transferase n=1 Tax=uncultured Pseudacidovorax sp. TaxID=679313 RepID=UPI0025F65F08
MDNTGPLAGYRIVEFDGKGPAPFCGMLLGDLGADVVQITRPESGVADVSSAESGFSILNRNRRSIALNLRHEAGREAALRRVEDSGQSSGGS